MKIVVLIQDGVLQEAFADDAAMALIRSKGLDVIAVDIDSNNDEEPAIVKRLDSEFSRLNDSIEAVRFLERLEEDGERAVCQDDGRVLA
jgi:hypothetical protein